MKQIKRALCLALALIGIFNGIIQASSPADIKKAAAQGKTKSQAPKDTSKSKNVKGGTKTESETKAKGEAKNKKGETKKKEEQPKKLKETVASTIKENITHEDDKATTDTTTHEGKIESTSSVLVL